MSLVAKIRDRVRSVFGRPFRYFDAEWERMAPRERRLVAGLSIAVLVVAMVLGTFLVFSSISDLEEGNADIREALGTIAKSREEYLEAKARAQAQEQRLGSDPPQLVADIEAAAREEMVQIAESNERPPLGVGKRWIEHDVDLKIRGVDLQALARFLRRVETGPRPIFTTRLSLKRRFSEADKLDAELTATAFERVKDSPSAKKKPDGKEQSGSKSDGKNRPAGRETP
jgi:type II secretory pathway component PulM